MILKMNGQCIGLCIAKASKEPAKALVKSMLRKKKRVGEFDRASEGQMKKSQCDQLNRRWESETLVQRYNHCPESMFDKNDL